MASDLYQQMRRWLTVADYRQAVFIEDLGQNLYRQGGVLTSLENRISREETDADGGLIRVRSEFPTYYVDVYVREEGKKRTFVRWERVQK